MKRSLAFWAALCAAITLILPASAQAQTPAPTASAAPAASAPAGGKSLPEHLKVQTRVVVPFVVQDGERLTGFSIDLWREIARRNDLKYDFQTSPTVKDLLTQVDTGKADLGIAAISITSARDEEFDFSQPIFDSGLQILVRDDSSGGGSGGAVSMLKNIFSRETLKLFGVLLLIVIGMAHIVWLCERRRAEESMVETKSYFPGIFKATWWAAATLAAQADEMPKTYLGRMVAVVMMFTSAIFVAYFTAAVTTTLTVQQLQGTIKGPEDLPGKIVATTTGSTSATYLQEKRATPKLFNSVDEACEALAKHKVDAVVYDAPVLLYYAAHEGKGKARVVGPIFKKEDYGIAMPQGSPLRKAVNRTLLQIREDGTYDDLYGKWFGGAEGGG